MLFTILGVVSVTPNKDNILKPPFGLPVKIQFYFIEAYEFRCLNFEVATVR